MPERVFRKPISIPPTISAGHTQVRLLEFSRVCSRYLGERHFEVQMAKGARATLDQIESIIRINGLPERIDRLQIKKSKSDNIDLVPMAVPQIEGRTLVLSDRDLLRPSEIVRGKIVEALEEKAPAPLEDLIGRELSEQEQTVLAKVDLHSFDPSDPRDAHHFEILKALFSPIQKDGLQHSGRTRILDILRKIGFSVEEVEKIILEGQISVEDISFDLGTRRHVDRVTIVGQDGKTRSFTASIDKEGSPDGSLTHSQQEYQALLSLKGKSDVIQEPFGLHLERDPVSNRRKAVIFKNYLEGIASGLVYENLPEEDQAVVARGTGRMLGDLYREAEVFPGDLNPLNVIINETEEGVVFRICDLSEVERDDGRIAWLLPAVLRDYPRQEAELLTGFVERGGNKARIIVARLRNSNVYAPKMSNMFHPSSLVNIPRKKN